MKVLPEFLTAGRTSWGSPTLTGLALAALLCCGWAHWAGEDRPQTIPWPDRTSRGEILLHGIRVQGEEGIVSWAPAVIVPLVFLLPWMAMNWSVQRRVVVFEHQRADMIIAGGALGLESNSVGDNLDMHRVLDGRGVLV